MMGVKQIVATAMHSAIQYPQTNPLTNNSSGLIARDLGYFDSGDTFTGDVIIRDDKVIYRNVFSFTQRLRFYVSTCGLAAV